MYSKHGGCISYCLCAVLALSHPSKTRLRNIQNTPGLDARNSPDRALTPTSPVQRLNHIHQEWVHLHFGQIPLTPGKMLFSAALVVEQPGSGIWERQIVAFQVVSGYLDMSSLGIAIEKGR